MKKIFLVCILAATIIGCKKDPMKEINSGDWNHEKQLISLAFTNQAGDADIDLSAEDIAKGSAVVNIVAVDYSSPIMITAMEISYGATASVSAGESLSFDPVTHSATIDVTSADGSVRTYTVTAIELVEPLLGTWNITGMDVYGGAATKWGCSAMMNMLTDGGVSWDATTGPAAELDNTLTFTLEGVNENGETYGTCLHDAGADGLYADFTWQTPPDGYTLVDGNPHFRQIPAGESNWVHNFSAGTITFEKDGVTTTVVDFLETPGDYDFVGEEETRTLTVTASAFGFVGMDFLPWDDGILYSTYGRMMYWPMEFFVQVEKQ